MKLKTLLDSMWLCNNPLLIDNGYISSIYCDIKDVPQELMDETVDYITHNGVVFIVVLA